MNKFKYLTPKTLDEAVSLYNSYKGKAVYIAGGTDVMVKIKYNVIEPDYVISLKNISDMDKFFIDENLNLNIGAFVTHRMLETSSMIQEKYPIIYDAVSNIGSVQVRNVATMAGNIVNAAPSADGAIPLIALDTKVQYYGSNGNNIVNLKDFFVAPGKTILKEGEILTQFIIPPMLKNTGSAYIKFSRRAAMELPLIGVGALISLDDDLKTCKRVRIGLGVAAPTPMRAIKAEEFLLNKIVDENTLKEAGEIAADESKVRDSFRGQAWYRKKMIKVFVKRMGLKAFDVAREK
jgi:aerobic carbon-monoxide dehydrogenase medium subunit